MPSVLLELSLPLSVSELLLFELLSFESLSVFEGFESVCLAFTVILHLYFLFNTVAVIVAFPTFFAVAIPFEFTDTISFRDELHFIF